MDSLWQDLRYALRVLRKAPGFTIVTVMTLALGIGINTTITSTINGFMLRPLPAEDPDRLAIVFTGSKREGRVFDNLSYPNYLDLRDQNQVFDGLAAQGMAQAAFSSSGDRGIDGSNELVLGGLVSGNYFDVLGVHPVVGRTFAPVEDDPPNVHPVVVLSYALWQHHFNLDHSVVGRTIYLNGHAFNVIGVMPESFKGTKFALAMDFWAPISMQSQLSAYANWMIDRRGNWLNVIGRLKPDVTFAQAESSLNIIAQQLEKQYPADNEGKKVSVVPEIQGRLWMFYDLAKTGAIVALAAGLLVLLIACANVANLLLARAAVRHKEIGMRLALGAKRRRIVQQLLIESTVLALLGGLGGFVLAYWGAGLLRGSIPPVAHNLVLDFNPDLRVFKWTLGLSLLTGLVFGLAPAIYTSRTDLTSVFKEGAKFSALSRTLSLRNALIIGQVALSFVILICGGLFLKSLRNTKMIDPGFKAENLLLMSVDVGLLGYTEAEGKAFYGELARRLKTVPGVSDVSMASPLPLSDGSPSAGPVVVEGQTPPPPNEGIRVEYSVVGTDFFKTVSTPIVQGRDFTEHDRDGTPAVVIINQEMARRMFGGESNAIGRRFTMGDPSSPAVEVIGVAKNGRYRSLGESPQTYMFLPELQDHYSSRMTLLLRAAAGARMEAVASGARREIQTMDGRLPIFSVMSGDEHLSYVLWVPRMSAGMATALGLLGLLLATIGLYGMVAYSVSQRTREIGVRIALGARKIDILKLIISQGMILVLIGIIGGLVGAFALGRLLRVFLNGVRATDPFVTVAVAFLLALAAFAGCYFPARRALKVDPIKTLRTE